MSVIQVINNIYYGDGISNTVFFINHILDINNIPYKVLTQGLDSRIADENIIVLSSILNYHFNDEDVVLYHFGLGLPLNVNMERIHCKKVLVFHNATDPSFFREWNYEIYQELNAAFDDMRHTPENYVHAIALSSFSKQTLIDAGWKSDRVSVFPLYELANIKDEYDKPYFDNLNNGAETFVFTGRIMPHKKIEDVIRIYDFYNKNYNNNSRLFLIGNYTLLNYKFALDSYILEHDIRNVIFTGLISDEKRNVLYSLADIFLCMSEHEGFCIPLLEAFQRKIPVVAYNSTAISDTMGNAGVLVNTKDPDVVCNEVLRILKNDNYKQSVIKKQLNRLSEMTLSSHQDEFIKCLRLIDDIKLQNKKQTDIFSLQVPVENNVEVMLDRDSISLLQRISLESGIVVYGIGVIGIRLLTCLSQSKGIKIDAVCDKNKFGTDLCGFKVLSYEDCVANWSSSYYIITVRRTPLEVVNNLISNCIPEMHILIYDARTMHLYLRNEI